MLNVKIIVQYDGTAYHGWQIQPNGITIQGTLEDTIKKITGQPSAVLGAGRTDAQVHAIGQVASFRTLTVLPIGRIRDALNALLPDDIRVLEVSDEDEHFHPRFNAVSKTYFYLIARVRVVSPFLFRYAWRVSHALDTNAMTDAAEILKGKHDFSAFRGSGCDAKSTVRTISRLLIEAPETIDFATTRLNGPFLKITIEADAFLRHMVRNIVGTLVEIGRGKIAPTGMKTILDSCDRRRAGPTAPGRGLFLQKITY